MSLLKCDEFCGGIYKPHTYTSFVYPQISFDNLHHNELLEFWIMVISCSNLSLNRKAIPPDCLPEEVFWFEWVVKFLNPEISNFERFQISVRITKSQLFMLDKKITIL